MQRARNLSYGALSACLLAAVLGWIHAPGLYCSDDTRYLVGIHKLAHGIAIDPASTAERRLLLSLPFAGLLSWVESLEALFGLADLIFVSLVAAAYGCARSFLPRTAATVAAFAVALHPLLYVFAGALLPDVASSLAILVSMWAILRWETSGRASEGLFWAGFASGVSICVKESGAALLPLFAILLSGREPGSSSREWLADLRARGVRFAAGLAIALGIEATLFLAFAGQLHSSLLSAGTPPDFEDAIREQGRLPWQRLVTLGVLLRDFAPWSYGAPLVALIAMASPGVSREQRRVLAVLLAFSLWPLIFFTLGSTSFRAYAPPVIQARYFAPVVAPGALTVVASVWWLVPARHTRALLVTSFVALVALHGLVWSGDARRSVYATAHVAAWQEAQADLAERYPDVETIDTPGGHGDLARCRKILKEFPNLSDELVGGRLVYDAGLLDPPLLLLGPRAFTELDHPFVEVVRRKLGKGLWTARVVGSYPGGTSSLREGSGSQTGRAGPKGRDLGLKAVLIEEAGETTGSRGGDRTLR